MTILRKFGTTLAAVSGLAIASQAPEFSQQYHQRLGGALGELTTVVEQFDSDAQSGGYSRDRALSVMKSSSNTLIHKRGLSMQSNVSRYNNLRTQNNSLAASPELFRPYFVFQNRDTKLTNETWKIFKPAIPLTFAGAVWGAVGALFMALGFGIIISFISRLKPKKTQNPNIPLPIKSNLRAPKIRHERT